MQGVENDRNGQPKKLCFVEHDGGERRYVPLRFVRNIADGVVELAGPREGYHITRVTPLAPALSPPPTRARLMPDLLDTSSEGDDADWGAT